MLIVFGCNYRNAPIDLRERLAFPEGELPAALERLLAQAEVEEGVVISTCNRVELVARVNGSQADGLAALQSFICSERGVEQGDLEKHSYTFVEREAVQHLFSVASGLDSMILGEPQILGQVKQAYRTAQRSGTTGPILDRLFQQCLSTAKRVRTVTGISRHAVSVAYAAVSLARQIFGDLQGRKALVIGAGKMGQLVATHLLSHGVSELLVTSRTYGRAVLAATAVGGKAAEWEEIEPRLSAVDIVVSCTAAPGFVLERKVVQEALRGRRGQPLFAIDIAVPRDIEPSVNELDNVYLYDIDGLQSVVEANVKERRKAAQLAQEEIARDVNAYLLWRRSLAITPTIVSLRERLAELGGQEVARFRRRFGQLSDEQDQLLDDLVRGVLQKVLHRPVVYLRKSVERGDADTCNAIYHEIFGLSESSNAEERQDDERRETQRRARGGSGPQGIVRGGKDD